MLQTEAVVHHEFEIPGYHFTGMSLCGGMHNEFVRNLADIDTTVTDTNKT
jgi:hypothetical protein